MSLTLDLLREDLRTHLGMDSNDLDDTDADRLLNRSWWAVSAQLRFKERESVTLMGLAAGEDLVTLPSFMDAIQRIVIIPSSEADDGEYTPVEKIADWNMLELQNTNAELRGKPTVYSLRQQNIVFSPVADIDYTIRVKHLRTLSNIASSGPGVPREWHEVILWGAISRGFFARGDWNRGTASQNQQLAYMAGLDTQETKSQEDRVYSGFRVIRRRYP